MLWYIAGYTQSRVENQGVRFLRIPRKLEYIMIGMLEETADEAFKVYMTSNTQGWFRRWGCPRPSDTAASSPAPGTASCGAGGGAGGGVGGRRRQTVKPRRLSDDDENASELLEAAGNEVASLAGGDPP